jgi:hypothetical protein
MWGRKRRGSWRRGRGWVRRRVKYGHMVGVGDGLEGIDALSCGRWVSLGLIHSGYSHCLVFVDVRIETS